MIDPVYTELPPGIQILGTIPHGASFWSRTAKIEAEQEDGTPIDFFMKVCNYSSDITKANLIANTMHS